MVTLTSADIMALLKKNELEANKLEYEVVERLREKNLKVATAESCTGGLISERLTRVSGAPTRTVSRKRFSAFGTTR